MYYKFIENILTDIECDSIISHSLQNYDLVDIKTTTYAGITFLDTNFNKRKGWRFKDSNFVNLENKILKIINEEKIFSGLVYNEIPNFLFNQYGETDFLNYHNDGGEITENQATLTIIIQLNDNYEGGDFYYKINNIEYVVPKIKGSIFIFDSFMLHKVSPVISGIRYSLNTWPKYNKIKNII
jgi:predicted 2-oxoglutarate/Fe(II)-dependent dioxygenase YbiX